MGSTALTMTPIELTPEVEAKTPGDLVDVILKTTDVQVTLKDIKDPEGQEEFRESSDGLNYHRIAWRCAEEWDLPVFDPDLARKVRAGICKRRGYDPDDFASVLQATKERARLPFGWTALDLALSRAGKQPFRLLHADLAGARLPTCIAALALQLQKHVGDENILLPIEQLRILFEARKVVVSGAVSRLVEAGFLTCTKEQYNTGSAREYRVIGVEGKDYEIKEVKDV